MSTMQAHLTGSGLFQAHYDLSSVASVQGLSIAFSISVNLGTGF